MGYALSIFSIICGLCKRNSRVVGLAILLILWILIGFNSDNADFSGYKYYYDYKITEASGAGLNYGYLATEQLAWSIGLDFYQYRALFGAVALLLTYRFISRYSDAPNAVLAVYILMPFFYDVVQFKFFLASSFALTGISFLIDDRRYQWALFALFLIIAVSIHPAAGLFIGFVIGKMNKPTALSVAVISTAVLIVLIYSGLAQIVMAWFMDAAKAESYLSKISRFGFMPYFISTLAIVVLTACMQNAMQKSEIDESVSKNCPEKFLTFFRSGVFAFIPLTALCIVSLQNFYRPVRSSLIMFYIFFTLTIGKRGAGLSRQIKVLYVAGFVAWFALTLLIVMSGVFDLVVDMALTNNLLW